MHFNSALFKDCEQPFIAALKKLIPHVNDDGKKTIQSMIAEVTKRSACVENGDVKCILDYLANKVGIEGMNKLEHDVERNHRKTMTEMKETNKKAIAELKLLDPSKKSKKATEIVCKDRITKIDLINNAFQ